MADPFEPRRVLLKPVSILLKLFKWLSVTGAAALIVIAVLIWFFPGFLLNAGSGIIKKTTGVMIRSDRVDGNPLRGWQLERLLVSKPFLRLEASSLHIKLGWAGLVKKKFVIETLEADRPVVTVDFKALKSHPKKAKKEEPKKKSAWIFAAHHFRVNEGQVFLRHAPPAVPRSLRHVNVEMEFRDQELNIQSFEAFLLESTVTLRGNVNLEPFHAHVHLQSAGPLDTNVSIQGNREDVRVTANGQYQEARARIRFNLNDGRRWSAQLGLQNLNPRLFSSQIPEEWGRISGSLKLKGTGLTLPAMKAKADLGARFEKGPQIASLIRLQNAKARFDIGLDRGGIDGKVTGVWNFSNKRANAAWSFEADSAFLSHWIKEVQLNANVTGKAAGTWPHLQWNLNATLDDVAFKDMNIEQIAILGLGKGVAPVQMRLHTTVSGFTKGALFLNEARLHVEGRPERHWVDFVVNDPNQFAFLKGQGSFRNGEWKAAWSKFQIRAVGTWKSAQPFETVASNKGFQLSKLHMRSLAGDIQVAGGIRTGTPPGINVFIKTSRLDPSEFNQFIPGLELGRSQLEADLAVRASQKDFAARGRLLFTSDEIRILRHKEMSFKEINLDVRANGRILEIRKGRVLSSRGGTVEMSGNVGRSLVDLHCKADEFGFAFPFGLSGKTDADLHFTGRWTSPSLNGRVHVLSADLKPQKKKKEDKPEKKSAQEPTKKQPSPLVMDVKVTFDKDVWYKEGQSAVEAKGDITVRKEMFLPPILLGSIQTIRGDYIFYGRSFKIEEGRLTFLGQPQINPRLDVRALYVSEATKFKITLLMTGTLRKPELKLSSDPPLEETDIISVLVTGAPLSTPGEQEDRKAAEAAKLFAANYFAEKVRQRLQGRLDVDVLRFKVAEGGETSLTVGQNVTEDLFVSYSHALGPEAERLVRAEYELTRHWSLEGSTTSIGRYVIDLLFRFGFY